MEQSFLAWLRGRQRSLPQVAVGIGDDAAVIDWNGKQVVSCVDTITDAVDFLSDEHSLADIGHKALAVNLSDLAAMAADPVSALVALSLPSENATQTASGVFEGILKTAAEYSLAISGGDITCYEGPLSISITLIGSVDVGKAWLRSGALPGDAVCVSGTLGGSILQHHLRFKPRVEMARQMREKFDIHAAIDISDGLLLDLDRLCAASGCGVELDLPSIPISDDAQHLAGRDGGAALDHALGDGEDYELAFTLPEPQVEDLIASEPAGVKITKIGTITSRTGLWSKLPNRLERLLPRGFVHGSQ